MPEHLTPSQRRQDERSSAKRPPIQRQQDETDLLAVQRQVISGHTLRPVRMQRQATLPVLRAAELHTQETARVETQRSALQRQVADAALPETAISAALQRQAERAAPVPTQPASPADWVTVMRHQAAQVEGRPLDTRQYAQFTALQRQVAQSLVQGYRTDRTPERASTYAVHLVALQRHPVSAPVSRGVFGLLPAGERVVLQRAVETALQREQAQQNQDAAALQVHALQRQLAELDAEATQPVLQRIQARRGGGNPLPESIQRHLEQGLNHDLSAVRVHADAEADTLAKGVNAVAFTTGNDIFFRSGTFNPNTQSGLELLAHEVTHTVQQSQGKVGQGIDPDPGLEAQAQTMGRMLARHSPTALTSPAPPTQRPSLRPAAALQRLQGPAPANAAGNVSVATVVAALSTVSQSTLKIDLRANTPAAKAARLIEQAARQKSEDKAFWQAVQKGFEAQKGNARMQKVLSLLPLSVQQWLTFASLGGAKGLTYSAFLNQLGMMSYSNATDLSDTKGITAKKGLSVRDQAQSILAAAGYQALPTVQGLWGLQLRVFKPVSSKSISDKTIVTFRGTEGVVLGTPFNLPVMLKKAGNVGRDAKSQETNESFLDSMTDFVPYPTGYSQYEANEKLIIDPLLKSLPGNLVAVGHSLGGALAQLAVAKNPTKFSEVHTFQGAKIQQADVQKALAKNNKIQATHFSVNGDVVPGSGQASMPGNFYRLDRRGSGMPNAQTPDAVGGHNSPVAIELLRQFNQAGMLPKGGGLAQQLMEHGSADPMGKVTLLPSYQGTKGHANKEGAKQVIVGQILQAGTFLTVYYSNVAYNIYAERALPVLRGLKADSPQALLARLTVVQTRVTTQPLAHTAGSIKQLESILKMTLAQSITTLEQAIRGYEQQQAMGVPGPAAIYKAELQRRLDQLKVLRTLSKIPPQAIQENKLRLRTNLPDLWYAVNPDQRALYLKLKGQGR